MLIVACTIFVLSLAGLALLAWLLAQVRDQQQRMSARIDGLAGRLWVQPVLPNNSPPVSSPPPAKDSGNLLAGTPAPPFTLDLLTGGQISLPALLAPAKPLVLLFTDPKCGPCYKLLPDIGGWQRVYGDRLSFALISSGEPKTNIAMTSEYDIRQVLLQQEHEVVDAFKLEQAPAALVIQPNGVISTGPHYGEYAIRRMVADILGLAMPPTPALEAEMVSGIGQPAPRIRRPDLFGEAVEIGGPGSEPTLLLFWSPGCSGCQLLLPEIKAFEPAVERLRVLIVSRGPLGLNQEVGFRSPVVLDDDRSIARSLGVSGTPSAVLIDGRGVVATQVARGHEGVHSALEALAISFAATAPRPNGA